MAAGYVSLQGISTVLQNIEQTLNRVTTGGDRMAQQWQSFTAQTAGQPGAGQTIGKAKVQAANMGILAQGGELATMIAGMPGANFEKDYGLALRMASAFNVEPQAAASVIGTALFRKQDTDVAASRFLLAADLAKGTPAQMARVLGMTTGYTSTEAGLSAATVLSQVVEPERLPSAVEAASRTFMKDESKLAKKFKLQGLDERQRLDVLVKAMGDTGDEGKFLRSVAEKYDLGEEEGRALRGLLMGRGLFSENLAKFQAIGPGGVESRYQSMRKDDPVFRNMYDAARARDVYALNQQYGDVAKFGQGARSLDQSIALQLQRAAPRLAPFLTDTDTGQVGRMGRFLFGETMVEEAKSKGLTTGTLRESQIDRSILRVLEGIEANTKPLKEPGAPARNANL